MERKNQKKKESENGSTGEVAMTRGAKKNKRGRKKLSPDVTTVLRPPRVNLGLTYPSHTHHMHTHTHTHRVQMLYKSQLTTLSYEFVFIYIFCPQILTPTHTTSHVTLLVWLHLHRLARTHTPICIHSARPKTRI